MNEIEILSIGNELLKGITINTNAAEIGQALFKEGYLPARQTSIPDEADLLKNCMHECLQRSSIVIATGGLGPTLDDMTSFIAAELFESDFYLDEMIAEDLKKRYGNANISLIQQSTVPVKAKILKNEIGTAPGLLFHDARGTLILMPGVPKEMRVMLHQQVIPYLNAHFSHLKKYVTQGRHFFSLSESMVDPVLRQLQQQYPMVEFGIYPSYGVLSIYATLNTQDKKGGQALLEEVLNHLVQSFPTQHFVSASGKIEEAVHHLFITHQWTLCLAESCTGGSLGAHLTALPGASNYFMGSVVCYSNQLKEQFLNLSADLLENKGAVSEETAIAMVNGLLDVTQSDFGIAVTGIAGPSGGTVEKPIGTVWIAIARKGHPPHTHCLHAKGSREMIIERSVHAALGELLNYTKSFK